MPKCALSRMLLSYAGDNLVVRFLVLTGPLRFRIGRRYAIRNEAHKPGEAANRQTVDEQINAVRIDPAAADFKPASKFLADPLRRVGGVRAEFRRIGHATALAELQVRR